MKPQVDKSHYSSEYDSVDRFSSYWTQIEWVLKLRSFPVLEIGAGNAVVSTYLRRRSVPVVVADIDAALAPDCVASVHRLPFKDDSFGTVMACQVLEHLPLELFVPTLEEMRRVTRSHLIVSLPTVSRYVSGVVRMPALGKLRFMLGMGWLLPRGAFTPNDEHYWEIGWKGLPLRRITGLIGGANLKILRHFRLVENPYHHFFILSKESRKERNC